MLLFTYSESTKKNVKPYDNVKNLSNFFPGKIPTAKYYRKENVSGTNCSTQEVHKVIDCNACKVTRSANTKLNSNYYASSSSYLRSRSKKYEQGLAKQQYNPETNSIKKDGCDPKYNCGVFKRSNFSFNKNSAVSAGTKIMKTRHQTLMHRR